MNISLKEFVALLIDSLIAKNKISISDDELATNHLKIAQQRMIINDFDIINADTEICKRTAAKLIHYTLLNILNEKDEDGWLSAQYFKDIYDCHRCVSHIAQVYTKGIIASKNKGLFGVNDTITNEEAIDIIDRIMNKEKRFVISNNNDTKIKEISRIDLNDYLIYNEEVDIIDVRDSETYLLEPAIEDSVNIPLKHIFLNPYIVGDDKTKCKVLYCDKGYQSKLAGKLLVDSGYINVVVCHS